VTIVAPESVLTPVAAPGAVDRDGRPLTEATRIVLAFGADGVGGPLPANTAALYEAMVMRLRGILRGSDEIVAHADGVAAVLYLGRGEPETVAFVVARRLLGVLRRPYTIAGEVRIRPSIGAAYSFDPQADANALLGMALGALEIARKQPVEPFSIAT
jgi:hypothetical protein